MALKLVVGLGNFRGSYQSTPHNIGYEALDVFAGRGKTEWRETQDRCLSALIDGVRLVKPQTYMNTSGPVVKWALDKWMVPLESLLVVCDDFALPWGRLRLRRKGSSGGHNGLESAVEALGSGDFARLRVGVGPVPAGMDPKDFVLKRQPPARMKELASKAAEALMVAVSEGLDVAMNRFNALPEPRNE